MSLAARVGPDLKQTYENRIPLVFHFSDSEALFASFPLNLSLKRGNCLHKCPYPSDIPANSWRKCLSVTYCSTISKR